MPPKRGTMRHNLAGEAGYVETWWSGGVRSDSLEPVSMPVGLEVTIATMLRHLPSKREREAKRFLALTGQK
jgi:hypothetical protein